MTTLEQEIQVDHESWLERTNFHLGKGEKTLLRHMAYHYMARIKSLKAKLKRVSKRRKEHDRL